MKPSRRLAHVAIAVLLSSCRPPSPDEAPSAWELLDLTRLHPRYQKAPTQRPGAKPFRVVTSHLGAEEVRDLAKVTPGQLERVPRLSAGLVAALRQHSGSRLRWDLELGRDPSFSFLPLTTETFSTTTTYRVLVAEPNGEEHELLRHRETTRPLFAPRRQEVDLSAYAGATVGLVLEVEVEAGTEGTPPATWGSPVVVHRVGRDTPPTGSQPSIVLLGIDTLRADHLGAWGRDPSLTPSFDALAAESDVWLDAFSCFNVTNPSFVSLFSGLYGKNHGVYDFQTPLPQDRLSLAEALQDHGFATAAILSARHLQDAGSGLAQGFDEFLVPEDQRSAEMAVNEAMGWISRQPGPFFLWLHLFDPHTPHSPPEPFSLGERPASAFGLSPIAAWTPFRRPGASEIKDPVLFGSRELYEGEVAYLDRQVGRLMDFLESRGWLENTIVAVVADHGENIEEHGITYRHAGLYDATTHVPLMIRWPGKSPKGRRVRGLVQNIDLYPTLLGYLGIPFPEVDGLDLRELTGPGRRGRPLVFAEPAYGEGAMVRDGRWKYFEVHDERIVPKGSYLFDLREDPLETRNLAGQGRDIEARLAAVLRRWRQQVRTFESSGRVELSAEDAEALRALGYL